jgi:hypothetical protein
MPMKGVPLDYKQDPELRAAYEEGGRAIGRMIMHDPDREEYFWKLMGPLKLWPRWYLLGFKGLYSEENPLERQRVIKRRCRRKKRRA